MRKLYNSVRTWLGAKIGKPWADLIIHLVLPCAVLMNIMMLGGYMYMNHIRYQESVKLSQGLFIQTRNVFEPTYPKIMSPQQVHSEHVEVKAPKKLVSEYRHLQTIHFFRTNDKRFLIIWENDTGKLIDEVWAFPDFDDVDIFITGKNEDSYVVIETTDSVISNIEIHTDHECAVGLKKWILAGSSTPYECSYNYK